jgi:hypothetical protein
MMPFSFTGLGALVLLIMLAIGVVDHFLPKKKWQE